MSEQVSADELAALIERVFQPQDSDTKIAVLVDLPDEKVADNDDWKVRRQLAGDWADKLWTQSEKIGLETDLYLYRNVHMNNADLPGGAWLHEAGSLPNTADQLDPKDLEEFSSIFKTHSIIIAPTEFSATAPLKLNAKEYKFRAATMPGFAPSMIPALRLDYQEINRRCNLMKELLDQAVACEIVFTVDQNKDYNLTLDLRHRTAHASGGIFPTPGTAGNVPSGETYIVPYENEIDGDPSQSSGQMPVQFKDDVVIYNIEKNKAASIEGDSPAAERERKRLAEEPAYGNLAELGLGVLADFGLDATGELLLDEKLALHIAFGRSDHFGGQVGAAQFSSPEAVVHIDRVYLKSIQPRIQLKSADIKMGDNSIVELIKNDAYVIDFKK
jgi:leucyl aminopeptidase (aminopeptidase T)